ncbi:MAG: helix-turn-helix domain-containing protein, partial [Actinomycetota bacterium]|nr:helix-turn-helix domain-containing protein [Actinomycetota bacterium]
LGGTVTVGAAGPATGVPALGTAYRDARRCLMTLLALGRAGEVADPVGLGFARLLLGQSGPAELQEFVTSTVGPVLEYDERRGTELLATLDAWFGCGGRTTETATALHVHPNTVGQRLDRVTSLLGEGWRDPQRALEVRLAVRLWRLRDVAGAH